MKKEIIMTVSTHKRLTEIKIRNAKSKERLYRLYDGSGLCLKIMVSGKKIWEYRYKNPDTSKDDTLVLGDYPTITLAEARKLHQSYRAEVLKGNNPKRNNDELQFERIFEEWWAIWSQSKSEKYAKQVYNAIKNNCFETLSHFNIDEIEVRHIVQALQPFEERNALEYLHRTKTGLRMMFNYAVARGLCQYNPVMMVSRQAFKPHQAKNHRSLDPMKIYTLFSFFEAEQYSITTRLCIELILRTLTRAQESCKARWEEIDFTNNRWVIPPQRMKMNREHIIPLTPQIIHIFKKMLSVSGHLEYVFPSMNLKSHICLETPLVSIKRYGIESTIHGFRHLGSTLLNESGLFRSDIIEASLAHQDKNSIRATYNKALYLNERRELLLWWNNLIDQCAEREQNRAVIQQLISY